MSGRTYPYNKEYGITEKNGITTIYSIPKYIRCEHCNRVLPENRKLWWSRSRKHFCSKECFQDDKPGVHSIDIKGE